MKWPMKKTKLKKPIMAWDYAYLVLNSVNKICKRFIEFVVMFADYILDHFFRAIHDKRFGLPTKKWLLYIHSVINPNKLIRLWVIL